MHGMDAWWRVFVRLDRQQDWKQVNARENGIQESCTFVSICLVVDVDIEMSIGVRHEDFVINKVKSPQTPYC